MSDLEDNLRELLRERAGRLEVTDQPTTTTIAAAAQVHQARVRRRAGIGLACIAVAGLAVAISLSTGSAGHSIAPAASSTATPSLSQSPSGSAPDTAPVVPLTPSYPTGVSMCDGDEYSATTTAGTIGLTSCAGLAGLSPLPTVTIPVGGRVTIAGMPGASPSSALTMTPEGILDPVGDTFLATAPGTAVITVHGAFCVPLPDGHQPTTCPLVSIVVR